MDSKNNLEINLNFEQALIELENIVLRLERGEAGLDEAMNIYARGQQLKELCNARLANARLQVDKVNVDSRENISISSFDPEN